MKVIIFGATGMVGQCVLTECLKSSIIKKILIIGRRSCEVKNDKIKEIIHDNFLDYSKKDIHICNSHEPTLKSQKFQKSLSNQL